MLLREIDWNSYKKEVVTSGQPTMLCFFKKTFSQNETALSIEALSRQFESIQFCAVQEEEHELFFGEFHFLGTPICIFLVNGSERARLFGQVSAERLRAFIERNIRELKTQ